MLSKLCIHCHNHFVRTAHPDTYTITGGALALTFAKEGQRLWIVGSDLNDGVYTWHAAGLKDDDDKAAVTLKDETFSGTVLTMAPPAEFLALADEIAAWEAQYGDAVNSPYQSEDVIGVYNYSKKQAASGGNGGSADATSWQGIFRARLIPYMRPCE